MIAHAPGKRRGQTKVFPLLLIPLLFLGIVRRFPAESYTDMSFALVYGLIDVNLLHTFGKYYDVKEIIQDKFNINSNIGLKNYKDEYVTILEYYKNIISEKFGNETRNDYTLEEMNRRCRNFPDVRKYRFSDECRDFKRYKEIFEEIYVKVIEKIENIENLNEIYELFKKFPVEYNSDYDNLLIKDNTSYRWEEAYIEIEYPNKLLRRTEISTGYASLMLMWLTNDSMTVLLRFENLYLEGLTNYTVYKEIIENAYFELNASGTAFKRHKYVDVKWGEWVNGNTLELIITKNHDERIGELQIKITIKDHPNIVAFIED